jgi:hypothetical protein
VIPSSGYAVGDQEISDRNEAFKMFMIIFVFKSNAVSNAYLSSSSGSVPASSPGFPHSIIILGMAVANVSDLMHGAGVMV